MDEALAEAVRRRANHACEYCRMPQTFYPTVPFPVDHIIARQHGGPTVFHNLALSPACTATAIKNRTLRGLIRKGRD